MQSSYLAALQGVLASPVPPPNAQQYQIVFRNDLLAPIQISWLDHNCQRVPIEVVAPNSTSQQDIPAYVYDYFLATSATSGSFVGVLCMGEPTQLILTFDPQSLLAPFDIGPIPSPNTDQLIPGDSPQVMVGCGPVGGLSASPGGNGVVREQSWQRSPESYSLAPGESKTVSVTLMEGRQDTTSAQEVISESLSGTSALGWGPIAASISASLNSTSTYSQSTTVQTQTVRYLSDNLTNPAANAVIFFKWNLVDVVTVFDPTGQPLAAVVTSQSPAVTTGPFDPGGLPLPPRSLKKVARVSGTIEHLPFYMQRSVALARALTIQDALTDGARPPETPPIAPWPHKL